jgi:hypothetical protein
MEAELIGRDEELQRVQRFLEGVPTATRALLIAGEAVRASSEHERVHRLVETVFDAYERGAPGLTAGRREANDVPAVRESMDALEGALDALVVEALRPQRPDAASVATLRGLTDLEVWRTMREQGATQETAVDLASAAVERWLEAHPAR